VVEVANPKVDKAKKQLPELVKKKWTSKHFLRSVLFTSNDLRQCWC